VEIHTLKGSKRPATEERLESHRTSASQLGEFE
jgi:hypothetical protein